jgi:hypothetical protein
VESKNIYTDVEVKYHDTLLEALRKNSCGFGNSRPFSRPNLLNALLVSGRQEWQGSHAIIIDQG